MEVCCGKLSMGGVCKSIFLEKYKICTSLYSNPNRKEIRDGSHLASPISDMELGR